MTSSKQTAFNCREDHVSEGENSGDEGKFPHCEADEILQTILKDNVNYQPPQANNKVKVEAKDVKDQSTYFKYVHQREAEMGEAEREELDLSKSQMSAIYNSALVSKDAKYIFGATDDPDKQTLAQRTPPQQKPLQEWKAQLVKPNQDVRPKIKNKYSVRVKQMAKPQRRRHENALPETTFNDPMISKFREKVVVPLFYAADFEQL